MTFRREIASLINMQKEVHLCLYNQLCRASLLYGRECIGGLRGSASRTEISSGNSRIIRGGEKWRNNFSSPIPLLKSHYRTYGISCYLHQSIFIAETSSRSNFRIMSDFKDQLSCDHPLFEPFQSICEDLGS